MKKWIAAGIIVLAACGAAAAQGLEGPMGRAAGAGRPRDEVFKMVDAYIVSNLQESLGLTDEQFVKLLPLVKRLQSDRRGLIQRRLQALHEMNRLLQSGTATESRISELMRELKAVETEEPATIRKDMDAIDAVLTSLQQAKFRVLEARVEQKIRELMGRVREQRKGGRNPRDGGPPDDRQF